jgi:hypothetical protein
VDETMLLADDDDLQRVADAEELIRTLVRTHYHDTELSRDENGLRLMQRLVDDGFVSSDHEREQEALGVVLGQVFAAQSPLRWVTVEWDPFQRDLALQYPGTGLFVFPKTMISKRMSEGSEIDFRRLFRVVVKHMEQNKADPEYARDDTWDSPVGLADRIDITAVRKDGGVDLLVVAARPLDLHPLTLRVVERKLRNYAFYVRHPVFAREHGAPSEEKTSIILRVDAELPAEYAEIVRRVKAETRVPARVEIQSGSGDAS